MLMHLEGKKTQKLTEQKTLSDGAAVTQFSMRIILAKISCTRKEIFMGGVNLHAKKELVSHSSTRLQQLYETAYLI